jgi:hypothetical protein
MLPIVIIEAFRTFTSVYPVFYAKISTRSSHSFLGIYIAAMWEITLAPDFIIIELGSTNVFSI